MPRRPCVHLDKAGREEAYRALFRAVFNEDPIGELRMALNQNQPIGNARFYAEIEAMTGQPRVLRQRGRPRKPEAAEAVGGSEQQELPL
jgi:putative transposase